MLRTVVCLVGLVLGNVRSDDNLNPLVWPMPQSFTIESEPSLQISSNFLFITDCNSAILKSAIERYEKITFPHNTDADDTSNALKSLTISVTDGSSDLQYGADESYTLTLPSDDNTQGQLNAATVWGAMRGLETFSQLVTYDFTLGYYVGYTSVISDAPRFSYRGLMVDTARHFQPMDNLFRVIEAMEYAKFNVLHWHMVDTQSFPYESKAYPKLWNGAYTDFERYSQQDVKEVVQFALEHGVRVLPEFDMPGHAASWCVGYPDICPDPDCTQPLNPAVDLTWQLIDGLINEAVNDVFIDDWIHLGGDEVSTKCWQNSASINEWMAAENFTTTRQVYGYFVKKAASIAYDTYHKTAVQWVEVFNNFNTTLNNDSVIIHVWKAKKALRDVVSLGFRGILSDNDLWYLDHLSTSWQSMYSNEPLSDITDPNQQKLVLGGEACMWGETVDGSDIDSTIWPRAAAVSERLWSDVSVVDTDAALERLEYFRCLLNERGIGAAPVNNDQARSAPPNPGSCYDQRRR